MTTLDHRTPTVLENVAFVETTRPVSPPPMPNPAYVTNPHRTNMYAAFTATVLAGGATVWAVGHDNPYVVLLAAVTLLLVAVTVGFTNAYNAWERPLVVVAVHDNHL